MSTNLQHKAETSKDTSTYNCEAIGLAHVDGSRADTSTAALAGGGCLAAAVASTTETAEASRGSCS